MDNTNQPHTLTVTHIPLDAPGVRIGGSIQGQDVHLTELREIIAGTENELKLTEAALADPKLSDLAKSVRAAHLAIQSIAFHLASLHSGIHEGVVNYPEGPETVYQGD